MSKVMLIEDDPTMLSLLGTLLQMEGFQVARLQREDTVPELLSIMQREKPDVALLDVHLRQINGFDVLKELRANPDLASIRVLMSSGMDVHTKCLEAGADDFILKPYMPDELIRRLHKLVTN